VLTDRSVAAQQEESPWVTGRRRRGALSCPGIVRLREGAREGRPEEPWPTGINVPVRFNIPTSAGFPTDAANPSARRRVFGRRRRKFSVRTQTNRSQIRQPARRADSANRLPPWVKSGKAGSQGRPVQLVFRLSIFTGAVLADYPMPDRCGIADPDRVGSCDADDRKDKKYHKDASRDECAVHFRVEVSVQS